jgi:outer membrane lipoprotein-sorting protein
MLNWKDYMKVIKALTIISLLLFFSACALQRQVEPTIQQTQPPVKPVDTQNYFGTWKFTHSDSPIQGLVQLKSDGTFDSTSYLNNKIISKITGKWLIRDNKFIWIYDRDHGNLKKGVADINPIAVYAKDKFVLQEMTASSTIFVRTK